MTPAEKEKLLVQAFLLFAHRMHATMQAPLRGQKIVNAERTRSVFALQLVVEFLESLGAPYAQVNLFAKLGSALNDLDKKIIDPLLSVPLLTADKGKRKNRTDPSSYWRGRVALVGAVEILYQCEGKPPLSLEAACDEVAKIATKDILNQVRGRKDGKKASTTLKNWRKELYLNRLKPKPSFDRTAAIFYDKMLTDDIPRTSNRREAQIEMIAWIGRMRERELLINPRVDQ